MSTTDGGGGGDQDRDVVLVVTARSDETGDAVEAALAEQDCAVVRMDLGEFPARLSAALTNVGPEWHGRLWNSDVSVDVQRIRAVYYRRPSHFTLAPGLSGADAAYARTEARIGLGGAFSAISARWVNNPARVALAEYKPAQLQVAARVGLATPRTLVTNDREALDRFAATVDGPIVCKSFSSMLLSEDSTARSVFTTVVEPATVDADQLAVTAHLVQEWVPKDHEVRVTMVGGRPFAVAILAGSAAARVDWRADYGALRYRPIDVPDDVLSGLVAYLGEFGLDHGAFDFIVQPDGRWRFLECNPNGQWLWLEHEVGLPIAAALAELLAVGTDSVTAVAAGGPR